MKHIITLLCFVLLIIAGTQNAQAQTKEETIEWIKEKLKKYGASEDRIVTVVNVSPCDISYTVTTNDGTVFKTSFNPSYTKSWERCVRNKSLICADTEIIRYVRDNDPPEFDDSIYISYGEPDIHERMIKALLHLATFCGKNETF